MPKQSIWFETTYIIGHSLKIPLSFLDSDSTIFSRINPKGEYSLGDRSEANNRNLHLNSDCNIISQQIIKQLFK